MKRIKTIDIKKHYENVVRMTYANGDDQTKTKGFTVNVIVFAKEENSNYIYGAWEICSDDSSCYGEGSLTFNLDGSCFDYDGCYDLSHHVCDILNENGYNTKEVDSRLF